MLFTKWVHTTQPRRSKSLACIHAKELRAKLVHQYDRNVSGGLFEELRNDCLVGNIKLPQCFILSPSYSKMIVSYSSHIMTLGVLLWLILTKKQISPEFTSLIACVIWKQHNMGKNKFKVNFTLWKYRGWGEFRSTVSWGWLEHQEFVATEEVQDSG